MERLIYLFSEKCNMHCSFCYGYFDKCIPSIEKSMQIVNRCKEIGVKTITFGGGDPLYYDYTPGLVYQARKIGMSCILDTNAKAYDERKHSCLNELLYMLSFPLDGSVPLIHDPIRDSSGHFNLVISAISKTIRKVRLRINSIIVKSNYTDVENIYCLLNNLGINEWSIFDFIPMMRGASTYKDFYIDKSYYSKEIESIINRSTEIKINYIDFLCRIGRYAYVTPNGKLLANDYDDIYRYKHFGNILNDKDVIQCKKYLDSYEKQTEK